MNDSKDKRNFIINSKKKLNGKKYIKYEIGDIIFPALSNYVSYESISFKIKKFLFNLVGIHYFKEYENQLTQNKIFDSLIIKSVKRENHEKMYEGFIDMHNLKKVPSILLNSNNISYKIYFPNFNELLYSFKILRTLKANSLFLYSEILYALKRTRELHEKININIKNNLYLQAEYTFPNIILLKKNLINTPSLKTYTFQFFNISEDDDFKPEQESFWLNSQVGNIIVWGEEYKKFLQKKLKQTNIIVSKHPLYTSKKTNLDIKSKNNRNIIICLNPPEKININIDFLKVIKNFCNKHSYTYSLRLHPIDNLKKYTKFLDKNHNPSQKVGINVVNNSTVYLDLIYENEIVLRYKHPKSYLNISSYNKDFFKNSYELNKLIQNISLKQEEEKREKTLKSVFNI